MRLSHLLLTSVLVVAPLAAHADTLTVTFSGAESGSFEMSSTPTFTADPFGDGGYYVSTLTPGPGGFIFYNSGGGGGFSDFSDNLGFVGSQLYTGTDASPLFAPGSFSLSPYGGGGIDETITFTATPEPSSLMLLGTGALGLAGAVRRRFSK